MTKNLKIVENSALIADVSSSAIIPNEQIPNEQIPNEQIIILYFQFDEDEPIKGIKCKGEEFTMKMLPVEDGFVEFTDGKKKFRMFVRHAD